MIMISAASSASESRPLGGYWDFYRSLLPLKTGSRRACLSPNPVDFCLSDLPLSSMKCLAH